MPFHRNKSEITKGIRPNAVGRGNPGNIPFFSSILKANRHPNKMPMMDTEHEIKPKFTSICPESME
jgi:hypothetical protein